MATSSSCDLLLAIGASSSSAVFSVFHENFTFCITKACCLVGKACKQLIKILVCEYKRIYYKTVLYGEIYSILKNKEAIKLADVAMDMEKELK